MRLATTALTKVLVLVGVLAQLHSRSFISSVTADVNVASLACTSASSCSACIQAKCLWDTNSKSCQPSSSCGSNCISQTQSCASTGTSTFARSSVLTAMISKIPQRDITPISVSTVAPQFSASPSSSSVLVQGSGGYIGSSYVPSQNRLYFVEYAGKFSYVDLIRTLASQVFLNSQGQVVQDGTRLNLQDGTSAQGGSIWWNSGVLLPQGNNDFSNLGVMAVAQYATVASPALQQITTWGTPSQFTTAQLTVGLVIGVRNRYPQAAANWEYAKMQVVSNNPLKLRWATYRLNSAYNVIGTGYNQPEDVVITPGRDYAYITERIGTVLKVHLSNANRASATVLASNLNTPQQLALDTASNSLYVIEYVQAARLVRIDLGTLAQTVMFQDPSWFNLGIGLLFSSDGQHAFVTLQSGAIAQLDFSVDPPVASKANLPTLTNPFFLTWASDAESAFYVPERDPANQIRIVRVGSTGNVLGADIALTGVPFRPSSTAIVLGGTKLAVCSDSQITLRDLSASAGSGAPYIMGIGLVPSTSITSGYATTDPGYFFQVKDSPFGGSLNLMINHQRLHSAGAIYYTVLADGVVQNDPWSDYLWVDAAGKFVVTAAPYSSLGYQTTRNAGDVWYNPNLGYILNTVTAGLTNGLHTITVTGYSAMSPGSPVSGASQSLQVMIDNTWPIAKIVSISNFVNGNPVPVDTCAVVTGSSDLFQFTIDASDADNHVWTYTLSALWGDNQGANIISDSYSPGHISANQLWAGVSGSAVPSSPWAASVANDPTSTRCAHTFYLDVWDRAINGYDYIHQSTYHKSVTLYLDN